MVVSDSQPQGVADLVFVVEATPSLGAYLEVLKQSYILPTLNKFNGGPPEEIDYGCDYSCTLYSLVTFQAADCAPNPAVNVVPPSMSTYQLLQSLDQIKFDGGSAQQCSHVAEGLSSALQLFDELGSVRDNLVETTKHCILVCNTPPYALPSQESPNYSGYTAQQLVNMMHDRGINFSLISPRRLPIFYELYGMGGGDLSGVMKANYTVDSRHTVLLSGFKLEERPTSPVKKEESGISSKTAVVSPVRKVSSPAPSSTDGKFKVPSTTIGQSQPAISVNPQPPVVSSQAMSQPFSRPSVTQPHPISATLTQSQMTNPAMATEVKIEHQEPQQRFQAPKHQQHPGILAQPGIQPRPQVANVIQQQVRPMQSMPSQVLTRAPGIQSTQPNMVQNQLMNQNPAITVSTQGSMPVKTEAANSDLINIINTPNFALEQGRQVQVNKQQKHIWTGALEWQDRLPNDTNKVTRTLGCHVYSTGADDINASTWPSKLNLQYLPSQWLQPLHRFFRQCRTVNFQFAQNDQEAIKSLGTRFLRQNWAGCINFPQLPQCDVRIMVLLHSNRQKAFMGLIPHDQHTVLEGIKKIVSQQKQLKNVQKGAAGPIPGTTGVATHTSMVPGQQQQPQQQQFMAQQQPVSSLTQTLSGGTMMSAGSVMTSATVSTPTAAQGIIPPQVSSNQLAGMAGVQQQPRQQVPVPNMGMPVTQADSMTMGSNLSEEARRANLEAMQNLQQQLQEAKRKELAFQQQEKQKALDAERARQLRQVQQQQFQQQQRLQQLQQQQQRANQPNPQQLRQILLSQQQQQQHQQQILQQQQQQQLLMQQPRGRMPNPQVQPGMGQAGMPQGAPGMQPGMPTQMQPQQPGQSFLGDEFDITSLINP